MKEKIRQNTPDEMSDQELIQAMQLHLAQLEKKFIYLTSYGNVIGEGSLSNRDVYNSKTLEQKFTLKSIKAAIKVIPSFLQKRKTFNEKTSSYGLKHEIEKLMGSYITNGDCIMAMLICGFDARFKSKGGRSHVNCSFNMKYSNKQ